HDPQRRRAELLHRRRNFQILHRHVGRPLERHAAAHDVARLYGGFQLAVHRYNQVSLAGLSARIRRRRSSATSAFEGSSSKLARTPLVSGLGCNTWLVSLPADVPRSRRRSSMSRPVPVNSTTKMRRLPSWVGPLRVEV